MRPLLAQCNGDWINPAVNVRLIDKMKGLPNYKDSKRSSTWHLFRINTTHAHYWSVQSNLMLLKRKKSWKNFRLYDSYPSTGFITLPMTMNSSALYHFFMCNSEVVTVASSKNYWFYFFLSNRNAFLDALTHLLHFLLLLTFLINDDFPGKNARTR